MKTKGGYAVSRAAIILGFIILHHVVLTLVTLVYVFIYMFSNRDILQGGVPFGDPAKIMQIIDESQAQYVGSLGAAVILIAVYLTYAYLQKRRNGALFSLAQPPFYGTVAVFVTGGVLGLSQLLMMGLIALQDKSPFLERAMQSYMDKVKILLPSDSSVVLQIVAMAVLVPIAEELLFRGIVQGELRRMLPLPATVILTALLFAVFHLDLIQGSYVFIAGLFLSWVYAWTDNLWIPIVMHMLYNFFGGGIFNNLIRADEHTAKIVGVILYACIPLSILAMLILRKGYRKKMMQRNFAVREADA